MFIMARFEHSISGFLELKYEREGEACLQTSNQFCKSFLMATMVAGAVCKEFELSIVPLNIANQPEEMIKFESTPPEFVELLQMGAAPDDGSTQKQDCAALWFETGIDATYEEGRNNERRRQASSCRQAGRKT